MSLHTLYEDLLFLGGYITDPHTFDKPLPNGDRVQYLLVGDEEVVKDASPSPSPSQKSENAQAA